MNALKAYHKAVLLLLLTPAICSIITRAHAQQRYDQGDPTVYEQLMLELINRTRANPGAEAKRLDLSSLNHGLPLGAIANTPKPPLAFQPHLIQAARNHSQWMLDAKKFQHEGPDAARADGGARMAGVGYQFLGNWRWAENIFWGAPPGSVEMKAMTIEGHERLFLSAGHRQNICQPALEDTGIGIRAGVYGGRNGVMVTQDFATSTWSPGPLVTGVVYIDGNHSAFYDPGEGVSGVKVLPANGNWFAVTSKSGGYAVPCPPGTGTLKVTFLGSILRHPITATLTLTGKNVKLDLDPGARVETATHFVDGSLTMSPATGFAAEVAGLPDAVFKVEYSDDLQRWSTVGTFTLEQHTMPFAHRPASTECGFYRLRR